MGTKLFEIFAGLKKLVAKYERPPLSAGVDQRGKYELWSRKAVEIDGRKKKEVYVDADIKRIFAPELLALLKGKSCFHVKALDAELEEMIAAALAAGFELYDRRGWI